MAQDKYIVALQIADKDLAKKLTIEEATLLGSLAEVDILSVMTLLKSFKAVKRL